MHLRLGRLVITTQRTLDDLAFKLGQDRRTFLGRENARLEAVVRRQHGLLVDAEFKRNVAEARLGEACGLLGEQQGDITRLETMLRHPVTKPIEGDQQ